MKRMTLAAALPAILPALLIVLGTSCAQADVDIYQPVATQRPPVDLQIATQACEQRFGAPQNGTETPVAFKQCMFAQGWQFDHSEYPDPDNPGLTCHDVTIFGVVGSSCSNF